MLLEPIGPRPLTVPDDPLVSAFLDGIQQSRMVGYVAGTPLIHATVAAAVRVREGRTLRTWEQPAVRRALFASRGKLGEPAWRQLEDGGISVVDITSELPEDGLPVHPFALRGRALDLIALEREGLERQLAAQWCRTEARWLWIDGGIAGNVTLDDRATAFGVVKSHNTLYGTVEQVSTVLALGEGERSPVFLVGHRARRAVASWYLRLRRAANGDPLHGLVRVEVAAPTDAADPEAFLAEARARLTAHCDVISGGILAERAPLSLPDPRWDTLTYGIHACEMYLQALVGP